LTEQIPSNALLLIKERISERKNKKLLALSDKKLKNYKLVLLEENKIICTKQNRYVLLRQTSSGVLELTINRFCADVLEAFSTPLTVEDMIVTLQKRYALKDAGEKKILEETIIQQIREALTYAILSTP
jgi:hypothetical protein